MSLVLADTGAIQIDQAKVLQALKLNPADPKTQALLLVCDRYNLDPLMKHMVLIEGNPYVTRDGYLHVAHQSGQFDGMEQGEAGETADEWWAYVSVYRKDMTRPFTYRGRYPKSGSNKKYGPEMALKVAEVMALRRAFDVTGVGAAEERWDAESDLVSVNEDGEMLASKAELGALQAASRELDPEVRARMGEWVKAEGLEIKPDVLTVSDLGRIYDRLAELEEEVSAAQFPPSVAAGDGTPGHGRVGADQAGGEGSPSVSPPAPAEEVRAPEEPPGDPAAVSPEQDPPPAPGPAPERLCHVCGGPILPDQACRKVRNVDAYQHKTCPSPDGAGPPPPGGGSPSPSEEPSAGQAEDPVTGPEGNGAGAASDTLTGEDGGEQSTAAELVPASKDPGQRGVNHRHIQALCTDLWSKHGPMSVAKRRHWLAGQVSGGRTESTNGLTVEEQDEMISLLQRVKEGSLEPHRRATGEWELRVVPGSQPRQAVA